MAGDSKSLTHCPYCGAEVDKMRAGAVGIFSGKISYFCSRECKQRFSSSSREAGRVRGEPAPSKWVPRLPPEVTSGAGSTARRDRSRAPSASRARSETPTSPAQAVFAGDPRLAAQEETDSTKKAQPPDMPLLSISPEHATREPDAVPETGIPEEIPSLPPVMRSSLEPPPRGQIVRWAATAGVGGVLVAACHVCIAQGWLDPGRLLALGLLVPAVVVALLHAVLEWRSTSIWRALDDVLIVGAVVFYAVPGPAIAGQAGVEEFTRHVTLPVVLLVVVWAARGVEAITTTGLEGLLGATPHSSRALAGLVGQPSGWGSSRTMTVTHRIGLLLCVVALPAGAISVGAGWLVSGEILLTHQWMLASAVILSLTPRLLRNVSTPVLASSLIWGREHGILFKDDSAFERCGSADAVVLRKSGVLVERGTEVLEMHFVGEQTPETVLSLVASCEEVAAEDEIAEALIRHVKREGIKPGDTRISRHIPSRGVQATSPFGEIFIGNRLFLIENGISVGRGETIASEAEKRGHTVVFISINRTMEAVAVLSNRVRPSARIALDTFRKLGLSTVLVTGDSFRTAESIGTALGVDQIRPEVGVGSREEEIGRLRSVLDRLAILGHVVDGTIRDTARGDVCLGLGWDGDGEPDAGWDVVVRGEDLSVVSHALALARQGRRFSIVNWSVAIVVGGLTLGLSASGLASPIMAALCVNLAAAIVLVIRRRAPTPGVSRS